MLVKVHRLSHLLRLLVSLLATIVFSLSVIITSAQPSYSVEGQLATHAADIAHLDAKQTAVGQDISTLNARLSSMADRVTRMETFGAACFFVLSVLQAVGAVTGKRLRLETARQGD